MDLLFVPPAAEVYPPGFSATVQLHGPIVETLEGARRGAGHFQGVTTVVSKLLGMAAAATGPTSAQKDAQQARVVRAMVADLNIDTEIVTVPTVREPDGLAMSSRNRRLSPADRQPGRRRCPRRCWPRRQWLRRRTARPTVLLARPPPDRWPSSGIEPEYLALVDADTFLPRRTCSVRPGVLAVAAQTSAAPG